MYNKPHMSVDLALPNWKRPRFPQTTKTEIYTVLKV
jgi:hypothetical protein